MLWVNITFPLRVLNKRKLEESFQCDSAPTTLLSKFIGSVVSVGWMTEICYFVSRVCNPHSLLGNGFKEHFSWVKCDQT